MGQRAQNCKGQFPEKRTICAFSWRPCGIPDSQNSPSVDRIRRRSSGGGATLALPSSRQLSLKSRPYGAKSKPGARAAVRRCLAGNATAPHRSRADRQWPALTASEPVPSAPPTAAPRIRPFPDRPFLSEVEARRWDCAAPHTLQHRQRRFKPAVNSVLSVSVGHQDRQICLAQHLTRRAAEHELTKPRMGVGTLDQQIGTIRDRLFHDRLAV